MGEVRGMKINKKQDRHNCKKLSENDRKLLETSNEYDEEYYDEDDDVDGGDLEFFKSERSEKHVLNHEGMFGRVL